MWFQKLSDTPIWKVIGNFLGDRGFKSKLLEEKYEANWNILGVSGCKTENLPLGSMEIFWNYTIKKYDHSNN